MSVTIRLTIGAVCVIVSACAVGPNYVPPKAPAGSDAPLVSYSPDAETQDETPDAWWRLYNDPALDALLKQAFAANEDLKAAEANLSAARAILEAARVAQYPATEIAAAGLYGRDPTTEEILLLTGQNLTKGWIFDALIDLSYEVDLFGRVRRSIEAARADAGAVAAARDAVKVTVAAETARAYADVCATGEEIAVAERNLSLVSREAKITEARNVAGANSEFDVVRAQALVAQVRATIPPLEGQRRAALFELTALIGRTPSAAPRDTLSCAAAPHLASLMPVGDGAQLLRRRPDVREAERTLAAATAQIGVATADLFPRIHLTGFYGAATLDRINLLGTNDAEVWGAGPTITWQFPNIAGPLASIHRAKSNATGALARFDSVILQALKETEQTLSIYRAELDHHQALLVFQGKTRRAFELARHQFSAGSVSNLDLLTAEQSLVTAEGQVAEADAAIVQDQIAVFKALGGGWGGG